jgi:hypothetical protein
LLPSTLKPFAEIAIGSSLGANEFNDDVKLININDLCDEGKELQALNIYPKCQWIVDFFESGTMEGHRSLL